MYRIVKRFFERGIYTKKDVEVFVKSDKITADEYQKITGEEYKEAE